MPRFESLEKAEVWVGNTMREFAHEELGLSPAKLAEYGQVNRLRSESQGFDYQLVLDEQVVATGAIVGHTAIVFGTYYVLKDGNRIPA